MYDSTTELLRKIRLGEDSTLELKAVRFRGGHVDAPRRESLANELAAIANTVGGVLVLGVDDRSRDILGIPLTHLDVLEQFLYEICNQSIEPPLPYRSYRIELPDETGALQPLLKIEVPRSLFVHKSPGGYFYRQGSAKREMPPDVLARLFQQRSQARTIWFDEQPVPQAPQSALSEPLWRRFAGPRTAQDDTLRTKLKLIAPDQEGILRPTVAGVLLCSEEPRQWLTGAYIQAVRYRGTRQDSNYQLDAADYTGPLDAQVWGALNFVERNQQVFAHKPDGRVERPQYARRAVYEALVNAVAHRDYSIYGSKIRLHMYDDRLELFSPGGLPNTLTLQSMALRQSTRNELVASLLARCPVPSAHRGIERSFMMDKRGDGVPIIVEETQAIARRDPVFELLDDNAELRVILWAATPEGATMEERPAS